MLQSHLQNINAKALFGWRCDENDGGDDDYDGDDYDDDNYHVVYMNGYCL